MSLSHATDTSSLSPAALSVWAKSDRRSGGWLQLAQHLWDIAMVAGQLYDTWLAPNTKRVWAACFPEGEAQARALFVFLSSAHDIGKASPVFAAQVETLAARCRQAGLPCLRMEDLKLDRADLPHATVSAFSAMEWLGVQGVEKGPSRQLASILGAHHGRPATLDGKQLVRTHAFGGEPWAAVRTELLDWLADTLGVRPHLDDLAGVTIPLPVQVTMCGLLVMADWLASNQVLFPLRPLDDDISPALPDAESLHRRAAAAWGEAGLPQSWSPSEPLEDIDSLYRQRFGWKSHWSPRPLQHDAVELVRRNDVGLIIVEAEMGGGKTETALALTEILAAQTGAHGAFVALPTQATTDAMYARVLPWIEALPTPPADVPAWAMTLAHGKSSLNELFSAYRNAFSDALHDERNLLPPEAMRELATDDGESARASDASAVVAHEWFAGRKRRLLANFGVGTIDQILMGALQQKHLMVRHLALAGKVIIIDECHASDSYMNVYLDRLLHWLGHYGAPVILLSATLTRERKEEMIRAYAPAVTGVPGAPGYPCLTWVDRDRTAASVHLVKDHATPRQVSWAWVATDDDSIIATLREELIDGGCALVVRNTVKDAQRLVDAIRRADIAPEATLVHSRFLAADRAANDRRLLERFGPESGRGSRPTKAIVVATQVVEQSLDVDFDVLITDMAPVDLLLQRIGRLHRHQWRTRPGHLQTARTHVIADRDDNGIIRATRGSEFVYGEHHLLRSAWVLQEHGPILTLPDDIAPLVQHAVGTGTLAEADDIWSEALRAAQAAFLKAEDERQTKALQWVLRAYSPDRNPAKATLLNHGWVTYSPNFSENDMQASVRDAKPSLEVIVACVDPGGRTAMSPPWMPDPATIDISSTPDDDTARRIASWTLKLPAWITQGRMPEVIDALAQTTRTWKWTKHPLLKTQPILAMRQVTEGSHVLETTITGPRERQITLRYDPSRGLEEVRDDVQSD